jgi:SAM-dependent methyltransferase
VGVDRAGEQFLEACAAAGVPFGRMLTLGRQELLSAGTWADGYLRGLGASSVTTLDASSFEGADVVADLNRPLPAELRRTFDTVLDGGTVEHVFDVATALRSTLDAVAVGGHYLAISPADGWPGHGFYQLSPELYFRILSPDWGFRIRGAFVAELRRKPRWHRVADPAEIGRRGQWLIGRRTYTCVVAQRLRAIDLTERTVQQSDYTARWDGAAPDGAGGGPSGLRGLVWRAVPQAARRAYGELRQHHRDRLRDAAFTRVSATALAASISPADDRIRR